MRQSAVVARWRQDGRAEFKAALPPNEKARGFKPAIPDDPMTLSEELATEEQRLAALAERIQNEGPVPVSEELVRIIYAKYPNPSPNVEDVA